MKKIVYILKNLNANIKIMILLFVFIAAVIIMYSYKKDFASEQIVNSEEITFMNEQSNLLGGWQEESDGTITESLKKIFEEATETDKNNTYEPIKLLASQVVAGFNYRFLADVTNNETGEKAQYYVLIFTDLNGKSVLKNVFPVEK